MNKILKNQKAFTIVELLVVVTIIAILTIIVVINLDRARKSSRDAQRKSDLSKMAMALNSYKTDNKSYPTNSPPPMAPTWENIEPIASAMRLLIPGGYLNPLPQDPTNAYYQYISNGTNFKIKITSELINQANPGTCTTAEDSIAKIRAGEFYYNNANCSLLQINSSDTATAAWEEVVI